MTNIYDLRCEYKRNPIDIAEAHPRLSWKLQSEKRGMRQTAYQIQVSRDDGFAHQVWDTGKVYSDISIHIPYAGEALQSCTRYYYRVRVWDQMDQRSNWSEEAYWETALSGPEGWQAEWIATSQQEQDRVEACDYMRKEFLLERPVTAARLYVTCTGLYQVFINGEAASDELFAPGWTSYNKRLQYQVYDVTENLIEGVNAIGTMIANGWYKGSIAFEGKRNYYGDQRALLLQLRLTYADGTEEMICSDRSWRWNGGPLLSSEIMHGETYDARLEEPGWCETGFHDAHWHEVVLADHGYAHLVAQENDPVRIVQVLKPVSVIKSPDGDTIVDMGQNMVGWVRFTIEADAGTVVTLKHAEVLDREGYLYTGNLRTAKQTITYICKGEGPETYQPYFSFQGFRYVQIEGVPAEGLIDQLVGCVIYTDMEPAGTFECSDERVNQLYRNILWGQKGNFLDIPTDCPQRDERLGWTGDAQIFVRTAAINYHVAPFFTKWLRDLAADQQLDGGVPHVIPDIPAAGYNSAAWGDAAVICPWTIYQCYGDSQILERQYASMKAWVEYIRVQGEDEFLWNTGFHFGDWLALDAKENSYNGATPKDLIATAYYAYSTGLLAQAAEVIGHTADAEEYTDLHQKIVDAFRREFVTPNGRVASPTQTAYALALTFDLLEEGERKRTARMLAEHVRENGGHLTTGFIGTPYLCLALTRFGYSDVAFDLLLQEDYPSWLYAIEKGATTIWEHWDSIKPDGSFWSDDMNSFNHYAYGAIGEWLHRAVAGIDFDRPGYKEIRLRPQVDRRLSYVKATQETMYGKIASTWEIREEDDCIDFSFTIPANTTAMIELPARSSVITADGGPLANFDAGRLVLETEAVTVLQVGSGAYQFTCTLDGI